MLLLLCASCLCAGSGADTARDESTAEHTVPQHDSTAVDTSVAADSSVAADTSVAAPSSAAGSAEAMDVQCPEGIHTGDVVLVRTSGGEEMEVTVPVGIGCERPCEASHRVCTALLLHCAAHELRHRLSHALRCTLCLGREIFSLFDCPKERALLTRRRCQRAHRWWSHALTVRTMNSICCLCHVQPAWVRAYECILRPVCPHANVAAVAPNNPSFQTVIFPGSRGKPGK